MGMDGVLVRTTGTYVLLDMPSAREKRMRFDDGLPKQETKPVDNPEISP